jgi:glycosyltransferase involved in cell wall biosynthesis
VSRFLVIMPKLSIIVPCYNEAKNIPIILEKFSSALEGYSAELILVNNGSTDESGEVIRYQLQNPLYGFARVVNISKNTGYGHGIISGLGAAKGDVLSWTHADLQTDPEDVVRAYKKFCKIAGNQNIFIKGRRVKRRFGDNAFTFGMSVIASFVLGKILYDINAQPKLFSRSFFEMMQSPPVDFSLDLYALYLAKKSGYKIHTIPVSFGERMHGESKWAFSFKSRYKTTLRTIRYIFALRGW